MVHPKITKLLNIPQHEQRSPQWFEQRKDKLTSSDAGTVLGKNPYTKSHELLFQKCGIERPFISNVATLHGQRYEDTAIEIYCRITGRINHDFGLLCYTDVNKDSNDYNNNYDFIAGSPDGISESIDNPDVEPILIEVKCPYKRPIKDGLIPECYVSQVQLNLFICDLSIADFIEYSPMENKINIVRIYKDYTWLNNNIPILCNFWNDVIKHRQIGLDNHPEMLKKKQREQKKIDNKLNKELINKQNKICMIID